MLNRTLFSKLLKGGKKMDHGKKKKGMKKTTKIAMKKKPKKKNGKKSYGRG